MKGLLLSNLYSIEKSIKVCMLFAVIAIPFMLMTTDQGPVLRIAFLAPFFLLAITSLETLKHDNESGWNKYEITLPVKRAHIIRSKYFTFLLLVIIGSIVTSLGMLIASFLDWFQFTTSSFTPIAKGVSIALCIGALAYPLTYILGTKKSEIVMGSSIGFSFGLWFLLGGLFSLNGQNSDEIFAIIHLIVSMLCFTVSYFVCRVIYSRKEF